ncbi:hypothetical protein BWQ96_04554 [Gracilariopsis chorda]|uniref:BZIP domain-containing protein n=1 Tax=Gracilariopsis chorda TaxID=448386 RepID=A0A2V3IWY4_9FLOR|nr:hypothetical protein BWQ96_04554 [Gracilariopsis chorda]|eukprot:PXF45650.1 hypothetical protein BWQ96_04554 [Gracilariopsis chorda]
MSTDSSIFPTHAEARSLASLATSSRSQPFSGIQYFHGLLRVLQDPAVSNFLFTPEPIELHHLAHPRLYDQAVANNMLEINVEPNANVHNSLSDQWNSKHFMFPTHTVDGNTYGFIISDDIYMPGSAWGAANLKIESRAVTRFVKNDEDGHTVFVAYYEDWDTFRLEYSKLTTSTQQIRFLVAVQGKAFRALLKNGVLSISAIVPLLAFMQMTTEYRKCPQCLRACGECYCAAPNIKPRHPFDYEAFKLGAMSRSGIFDGRTEMALFANGVKIRSGVLGSRYISNPSFDFDLVERLRRLAISDHVGKEAARHSHIFSNAVGVASTGRDQNPFDSIGKPVQLHTPLEDLGNEGALIQTSSANDAEVWAPLTEEGEQGIGASQQITPSILSSFLTPLEELTPSDENTQSSVVSDPMTTDLIDTSVQLRQSNALDAAIMNSEPLSTESGSLSVDQDSGTKTAKTASPDKEQVRRLKAELRREKNRASAQRSNMKKKAVLDALKHDLATSREKADLLRSKELLLRRENLSLKKQISANRSAGGAE